MAEAVVVMSGAIQLPNGDLWKGASLVEQRADNVTPLSATLGAGSADEAIGQMLTLQTGEMLSCVWCGQQFGRKQLNEAREHIDKQHFVASGQSAAEQEVAALQNTIGELQAKVEDK